MGAKFYFFTDPALLQAQAANQAYGPAGTSGGNDRFRVTDVHQRVNGAAAQLSDPNTLAPAVGSQAIPFL